MHRRTNSNPVNTVAKGYAGESPGAANCEIQVKNAVPSADFELNPGPFIASLTEREFTFFAAGKTLTTKGFIDSDNLSHATDTPAELAFECTCEFADWV